VLGILSSKPAKRRWEIDVQAKWFDPLNTEPASAYLGRAQNYLSGRFGILIPGKLFKTSSYVVFLRMNSLTALLVRTQCQVQHMQYTQGLSQKAQTGADEKKLLSSSRVSFVVSSANWHEWLSEGKSPSKEHIADIVWGLQRIAHLPSAILKDKEVPCSEAGHVDVVEAAAEDNDDHVPLGLSKDSLFL